jgi:hypothetical protein
MRLHIESTRDRTGPGRRRHRTRGGIRCGGPRNHHHRLDPLHSRLGGEKDPLRARQSKRAAPCRGSCRGTPPAGTGCSRDPNARPHARWVGVTARRDEHESIQGAATAIVPSGPRDRRHCEVTVRARGAGEPAFERCARRAGKLARTSPHHASPVGGPMGCWVSRRRGAHPDVSSSAPGRLPYSAARSAIERRGRCASGRKARGAFSSEA